MTTSGEGSSSTRYIAIIPVTTRGDDQIFFRSCLVGSFFRANLPLDIGLRLLIFFKPASHHGIWQLVFSHTIPCWQHERLENVAILHASLQRYCWTSNLRILITVKWRSEDLWQSVILPYGGFHKWGDPQIILILVGFSLINHPAMGVSRWRNHMVHPNSRIFWTAENRAPRCSV